MKKETYRKPVAELANLDIEQLMIEASPGVGGGYDPDKPIDGKGSDFFEEEEGEKVKPEGYNAFAEF